jgi:Icc-related predicted phosphoesterase
MKLRILLISDTHQKHHELTLPECDIILHAGDISGRGSYAAVGNFLQWFSKQKANHLVFIAGNHDIGLENPQWDMIRLLEEYPEITYLNNSGASIEGINIYGSPISPTFGRGWAFNRDRGEDIKAEWDKIPEGTDIIITHTPPYGKGDLLIPQYRRRNEDPNVGCKDLLDTIRRIKPSIHLSGHIHSGYGVVVENGITYINAAVLNDDYMYVHQPILIEFDTDTKEVKVLNDEEKQIN